MHNLNALWVVLFLLCNNLDFYSIFKGAKHLGNYSIGIYDNEPLSEVEQIERKLRQQQIESERDNLWLAEEETNLVSHYFILLAYCYYA